jgi:hypothetical protein
MASRSTSFRISDEARERLSRRAAFEGVSATTLMERLILEGVDTLGHPGIVFRGPPHDRWAALAGGPDVWEVVSRLRELRGREEQRIATLSEESELHPRQIRLALDYAATRAEEIEARIDRHNAAVEHSQAAAERRAALLG